MKTLFNKLQNNHSLLMILCCAIPLIAIMTLSYFDVLGAWAGFAIILLCPLMHLFMHKGHSGKGKSDKSENCH